MNPVCCSLEQVAGSAFQTDGEPAGSGVGREGFQGLGLTGQPVETLDLLHRIGFPFKFISGSDFPHVDSDVGAVLDAVDSPVDHPDDAVGDIEHLVVMGV